MPEGLGPARTIAFPNHNPSLISMKRFAVSIIAVAFLSFGAFSSAAAQQQDTSDQGQDEPMMTGEEDAPELMQLLQKNRKYSTLASALEKTGLAQSLNGPYTLLAPTNSAFEKLGKPVSQMSNEKLTKVLRGHVLMESYSQQELTQQQEVDNVSGTTLEIEQHEQQGTQQGMTQGLTIGGAKVTDPGMKAQNGMVHGIDTVITPDRTTSAKADSTEY
jgi:uncharacterized surface protein with fasciclin (FAS1) repeats